MGAGPASFPPLSKVTFQRMVPVAPSYLIVRMSPFGSSSPVDPDCTGLPSGPTAIGPPKGSPGPASEAVFQRTPPVAPSSFVARKSHPGLQEDPPTTGCPSAPTATPSAPPSATVVQMYSPFAPRSLNTIEQPDPPQPSPATTGSPSGPTATPDKKKPDGGVCVQRIAPVAPSYLITVKKPATTGLPSLPMPTATPLWVPPEVTFHRMAPVAPSYLIVLILPPSRYPTTTGLPSGPTATALAISVAPLSKVTFHKTAPFTSLYLIVRQMALPWNKETPVTTGCPSGPMATPLGES